jgi:hypothetical protein
MRLPRVRITVRRLIVWGGDGLLVSAAAIGT